MIYPFRKNKCCYYCGYPPPSTADHCPPKILFVGSGSTWNRTTVPSCDLHNNSKSRIDRMMVTSCAIGANFFRSSDSPKEILQLIENLRKDFRQANKEMEQRKLLIEDIPENKEVPYLKVPFVEIRSWFLHLTAGLVWKINGDYDPNNIWGDSTFVANWYWKTSEKLSKEEAGNRAFYNVAFENAISDEFDWHSGWLNQVKNYPKNMYDFKVSFLDNRVIFRHEFLRKTCISYVTFVPSSKTMSNMLDNIGDLVKIESLFGKILGYSVIQFKGPFVISQVKLLS